MATPTEEAMCSKVPQCCARDIPGVLTLLRLQPLAFHFPYFSKHDRGDG